MGSNTSLLVAAIDFGTTYSGWAFSFKHEYKSDPTKVSGKHYYGGPHVSMKAPTTILIEQDERTFHSFGYEAEDKYIELVRNGEHEKWYYFSRFKMVLYRSMGLTRDIQLEDETHKKLSAKTVFALAISYLKEEMLKTCRDRLRRDELQEEDIMWVLTVPAIWNDAAKQFMREAAEEAGIEKEHLKIALEPETASLFCRLLPVEKMVNGSNIVPFPVGSKYMVVDAGGGTVDISVHEVMSGGKLKELHKACGGALGGTQVDEAYTQFIISLVGNHVFQRFCQESKEDHLEMFREFEIKKRGIAPNKDADVTIRFPAMLKDIFEDETNVDFNEAIKQTKYAKELTLMGDKLRVNASMIKNLFTDTINNIMSLVKQLLDDGRMQGISSILMVGGFSECEMLQHAMKSRFPSVSVIVPQEAGLVVLKGAVVFGHSPASITQRVCKYTYGIEAYDRFDDEIHDRKRLKIFGGLRWCEGVFCKHVEMGQVVTLNETTEAKPYWLINDQINEPLSIYYSTEKSPKYVTDKGCVKLGDISIDIIDRSVPLDQSSVLVFMAFGGTEIEVTAKEERTGRSTKAVVNFLE